MSMNLTSFNLSVELPQLESITRNYTTADDSAPLLEAEPCKYVTLKNNGNDLAIYVNAGNLFTLPDNSSLDVNVSNTNLIEIVNLTGTLEYIVHQ